MTETLDLSIYVTRHGANAHMDLAVEGVACAGCMRKIEDGLRRIPGIIDARLNFTNRRLAVDWQPGALDPRDVLCALERIGYRAHPFEPKRADDEDARLAGWLVRCLAVAGFAGMNIMLLSVSVWSGDATDMSPELRDLFHWISALIALPCAAYAGQPFFRSAVRAIRARQLNMDVPISLGVLLALGMSVAETANHAEHVYFELGGHASVFSPVWSLPRARHAAKNPRGGRQPRGAESRGRAPFRAWPGAGHSTGGGVAAWRPPAGTTGRAHPGRWHRHLRKLSDRRGAGHR